MNGCEFKLQCDSDRNRGESCLTCDTDYCNLHRTSLANRIQNYEPEPIQLREPVTEVNLPAARVNPFHDLPNFANPFLSSPGPVHSQLAYQNAGYNPYFNPFYSAILLNPFLAQALGYSGATGVAGLAAGNLGVNALSNMARVDSTGSAASTEFKKNFAQQRLDSPGTQSQVNPNNGFQFAQLPFLLQQVPVAVPASLPTPVLPKSPPLPVRGIPISSSKPNLPLPPTVAPLLPPPNNRLKGDPELLEGEVMVDGDLPTVPIAPATIEFTNLKNIKRPDGTLLPPKPDIETAVVQLPKYATQVPSVPFEFEPRPFGVPIIQQQPAPVVQVPVAQKEPEISEPAIDLQPPKFPDGTLPEANFPLEPIVIIKPTTEEPGRTPTTTKRPITSTVPSTTRYTQRTTNKPRFTIPPIRRVTTSRGTRPTTTTATTTTARTTTKTTPVLTTTQPTLAEEITNEPIGDLSEDTIRPLVGENVENQNKNHLLNQIKVPSIYYEPPKIRYPYNGLSKLNQTTSKEVSTTTKRPGTPTNRLTLPPVKLTTQEYTTKAPLTLPTTTTTISITTPKTTVPLALPSMKPVKTILKMVEETEAATKETTTNQPVSTIGVPTPPRIILPPQIVGGITDEPSDVEKEVLAEFGETFEADKGAVVRQEDPAINTIGRAIGSKRIFRVNGPISFPTQTGGAGEGVVLQVNGQTGHQNLSKDNPAPAVVINKEPGPVTFIKALSRSLEPPTE